MYSTKIKTTQQLLIKTHKSFNLLNLLILALFIVDFAFGRIYMANIRVGIFIERYHIVQHAIIQFAVVIMGFLILLGRYALINKSLSINKRHQPIFSALLLWLGISVISTLVGIYMGNNLNYIIGDFYKFISLSGLFLLFYMAIKSTKELLFILNNIIILYAIFLSFHVILFLTNILPIHTLTSVGQYFPLIFPLLLYTVMENKTTYVKVFAWIAIFEIPLLLFFNQSLSLVINLLLIIIIFSILNFKKILKNIVLLLPVFFIILLFFFIKGDIFFHIKDLIWRQEHHLFVKTEQVFESSSIIEKIELIGGLRMPELVCIIENIFDNPQKIVTGFGMGSYLTTYGIRSTYIKRTTHFIHSVFGEVIFRTGLPGLILFLYFIILFIKKIYIHYNIHPIAILSLIFSIQLIVNYMIGTTSLNRPYLMFCLLFVGMLRLEEQHEHDNNIRNLSPH